MSWISKVFKREVSDDPDAIRGSDILRALQQLGWGYSAVEVPLPRTNHEIFHITDEGWERCGVIIALMGGELHLQGGLDEPLNELLLRQAAGGPILTCAWPLDKSERSQAMRAALEASSFDEQELQEAIDQVKRAFEALDIEASQGSADRTQQHIARTSDKVLPAYRIAGVDEEIPAEAQWPPAGM